MTCGGCGGTGEAYHGQGVFYGPCLVCGVEEGADNPHHPRHFCHPDPSLESCWGALAIQDRVRERRARRRRAVAA